MRARPFLVPALALIACSSDPRYLQPAEALEVGAPGTEVEVATASLTLPVRLEREDEAAERAALEEELGVSVPYVTLEDLAISIEWTVRNLGDEDGTARIRVNGANEYAAYAPEAFVVDPEEEEAPPPLLGDVPLEVPAGATRSGVFREDELHEAAIDLELLSRGGVNPFTALLQVDEEIETLPGDPPVPRAAFASMVRFDLAFAADRHMVLEIAVRVRDERRPNRIHELGLEAPAEELTGFAPAAAEPAPEAP